MRLFRTTRWGLALVAALVCVAEPVRAEEFPRPSDVKTAPPWCSLSIGSQPVKAAGLKTSLSMQQARMFYQKALAKQGWTIQPVPWMGEAQKQRQMLEQTLKEHPERGPQNAAEQEQLQSVLSSENIGRFQAAADQQLYAIRGAEHALLAFTMSGERTLIAVSRWEGDSRPPLESPAPQTAEPVPAWPAVNPCCTGEVPAAARSVPSTVPPYPNGRMVTAGASPAQNGRSIAMETYMTADSADQVAEFYRRNMGYNGWIEGEEPGSEDAGQRARQMFGAQAGQLSWKTLTFRNDHGLCTIVVTEYTGAMPSASPMAATIAESQGRTAGTNERTMIGINYVESSFLRQP